MAARPRTSDADVIARSVVSPESFGEVFDRHFTAVHRYLTRSPRPLTPACRNGVATSVSTPAGQVMVGTRGGRS